MAHMRTAPQSYETHSRPSLCCIKLGWKACCAGWRQYTVYPATRLQLALDLRTKQVQAELESGSSTPPGAAQPPGVSRVGRVHQ